MRRGAWVWGTVIGGLLAWAPVARAGAAGEPKAVIAAKQWIGAAKVGERTKFTIPIRNTGTAPLQVTAADGGCGCIQTRLPAPIAPGQTGQIGVTFEPQPGWSGKIDRLMRITTNDRRQPELRVVVSSNVIPYVVFHPASPFTLAVEPGKTYHQEFTVAPRPGFHATLSSPTSEDPAVKAVLVAPRAGSSQPYRLRVTLGPVTRPGDFDSVVKLKSSARDLPNAALVIHGQAKSGVVALPDRLVVPSCTRQQAEQKLSQFMLMSRKTPVRVLSVSTGSAALKADVIPTAPGHVYAVIVHTAGPAKPGRVKTTLKVNTDDPHRRVITVPLDAVIQ